ncbi:unnamed protein product [Amoebophrya sp. A120]|nr:unnamed protein product [Amoebophrya sp. A120]|eukprot:GSA120T00022462001.1
MSISKLALQNQEQGIKDALEDLKKAIQQLQGQGPSGGGGLFGSSSSSSSSKNPNVEQEKSRQAAAQIRVCNQLVSRCRNLLEALQLELRACKDEVIRGGYEQTLSDFRSELKKQQTELEFRKKEIQRSTNQQKSKNLLGKYENMEQVDQRRLDDVRAEFDPENPQMNSAGSSQFQLQQQSNRAIQLGDKLQDRTEESLKRILRMAADAEQIGTRSLQTMHAHEERMGRTMQEMDDVQNTLQRTRHVVSGLMRGAASDKCVQMLCAFYRLQKYRTRIAIMHYKIRITIFIFIRAEGICHALIYTSAIVLQFIRSSHWRFCCVSCWPL